MNIPKSSWEFNVLNLYNYNLIGPYEYMFSFLENNQHFLKSDILEAGTFNGRTALSLALFLKEKNLPGQVRAFDTFEGFPNYSKYDEFELFQNLYEKNRISIKHFSEINKMTNYANKVFKKSMHPSKISTSGNFSKVDLDLIKRKKEFLGLNNLILYKGEFSSTMKEDDLQKYRYSLAFIDCDLYDGYVTTLEYVWPKLEKGGIIFLDEYYSLKFPGPRIAVDKYLAELNPNLFELKRVSRETDDFERWIIQKL